MEDGGNISYVRGGQTSVDLLRFTALKKRVELLNKKPTFCVNSIRKPKLSTFRDIQVPVETKNSLEG